MASGRGPARRGGEIYSVAGACLTERSRDRSPTRSPHNRMNTFPEVTCRRRVRGSAMPAIILVVSTLVFWLIYWFVQMGGVDRFVELVARRRDAARRAEARESERSAPLRAIDDPRDAATVLMLLIPRGGDPTQAQVAA